MPALRETVAGDARAVAALDARRKSGWGLRWVFIPRPPGESRCRVTLRLRQAPKFHLGSAYLKILPRSQENDA